MFDRRWGVLGWTLLFAAGPVAAGVSSWHIEGAKDAPPYRLSFAFEDAGVSYRFECRPEAVVTTETGVTSLMDPGTGQKVGDTPGSAITPAAASMALYTNRVKPSFAPAAATQNAAKGWDLTLSLDRKDAAFQSLPKAKSMSLMTTGWTGLVELDDQDRKVLKSFVDGCDRN